MPAKAMEPSSIHYPIDNDWLEQYAHNANKYVDIDEIKKGDSQYVADLIAMGKSVTVEGERQRANFHIQAVYIGSIGSGENNFINGRLREDSYDDQWCIAATSFLQVKMQRIYAKGTDARNIKFTGFTDNA